LIPNQHILKHNFDWLDVTRELQQFNPTTDIHFVPRLKTDINNQTLQKSGDPLELDHDEMISII